MVTLTGPGAVGKTRLALQAAHDAAVGFLDGVVFVGIAPITDPHLVTATIAQALGVREAEGTPRPGRIAAALHDKRLLLVLDNFEQVVDAAPDVSDLLVTCPRLTILVTSRSRLRLSGEREHAVPPLELAEPGHPSPVEEVGRSGAVRLFVERAQAVKEDFVLTPENAGAVAEICRRLDGLPLAIELAAARTKMLSPLAMLARLDRLLPLLTGGGRDAATRRSGNGRCAMPSPGPTNCYRTTSGRCFDGWRSSLAGSLWRRQKRSPSRPESAAWTRSMAAPHCSITVCCGRTTG